MRSQTIARAKSHLPHTFSSPTDLCGRACALLKSVEKLLEDLASELVVKSSSVFLYALAPALYSSLDCTQLLYNLILVSVLIVVFRNHMRCMVLNAVFAD